MIKRLLMALGVLLTSPSLCFASYYEDVQLCTNAYNHVWFSFETIKSNLRTNTEAQEMQFTTEFSKVVTPDVHFEIHKFPIPPDFTDTVSTEVDGIKDLVDTAVFSIVNFGEHHVATPFSVKKLENSSDDNHVYSMTTQDVTYTRDAAEEGGCTVYLSQKDIICTVGKGKEGKALLNQIVNNVITAYTIPAPQCAVWSAPPLTPYV